MKTKKVLSLLLAVLMCVSLLPVTAGAAVIASGTWGDCPWELDDQGVLTVHPGDADDASSAPWKNRDDVKSVVIREEDGKKTAASSSCDSLFGGCGNITSIDLSGLDTSGVTGMVEMFYNCSSLASLNVSGWKTSSVTDMKAMFYGCSSLTSLDVSKWDTSGVTSMYDLFRDCSSLTVLDVSGWDTSSVTDMAEMFFDCSSLTSLDMSGWDFSNIEDGGTSVIFYQCENLSELTLPSDYKITAASSSKERGGACISHLNEDGKTVTLTAFPIGNNVFKGWQEGESIVSTADPYEFTATENRTLTAVFGEKTATPGTGTGNTADLVLDFGGYYTAAPGDSVNITVKLAEGDVPVAGMDVFYQIDSPLKIADFGYTAAAYDNAVVNKNVNDLECNFSVANDGDPVKVSVGKSVFSLTVYIPENCPNGDYTVTFKSIKVFKQEDSGDTWSVAVIPATIKVEKPAVPNPDTAYWGDANCDGQVDMADAVLIKQSLANPNRYGLGGTEPEPGHLTEEGKLRADVDNSTKGLTSDDAVKIQEFLLGKIDSLTPVGAGAALPDYKEPPRLSGGNNVTENADVAFSFMDDKGQNNVMAKPGKEIKVCVIIDAGDNNISAIDAQFKTQGLAIDEFDNNSEACGDAKLAKNEKGLRANFTSTGRNDGEPVKVSNGKDAFTFYITLPTDAKDVIYTVGFAEYLRVYKGNTKDLYSTSFTPLTITVGNPAVTLPGTGKEGDPYQISTAAQLGKFRDIVNGANGETQNSEACAELKANIDLGGLDAEGNLVEANKWTPIGPDYNTYYTGTFNGAGYEISGLKVSGELEYAGLFGYIGNKGVVENLSVSGKVEAEAT
ncbi:MAG: BspA family leucine-rich repeat surface protein, partial [Oscillospiraceae bacterium]|nr:BspA family leucine-rich repeat surface protein [Oscillospiraceae bacterium]